MKAALTAALIAAVWGCSPAPESQTGQGKADRLSQDAPQSASDNKGGDVQVLTGGAGAAGASPVVGGENLQGSGSGVNDAAKDAARRAGSKVSGSTAGSANAGAD